MICIRPSSDRLARAFGVAASLGAMQHFVLGTSIEPPFPETLETAQFGMGCFWGAERGFWEAAGVYTTAVGYAGGRTESPTYEEICAGITDHAEVVLVVFDPAKTSYTEMLRLFWEGHDPTQGMRQGNDVGSQYRSWIGTTTPEQARLARDTAEAFGKKLNERGYGPNTTQILAAPHFWYAEDYHQQYLAKNPHGYCGLGGTGARL
jgi:peptide-methionine (S)-S-oxide reductase